MKSFFIILVLFSSDTFARGVEITCWEKGVSQTPENYIYFNDGGYRYGTHLLYEGLKDDSMHPDTSIFYASDNCINWDLPNQCKDVVVLDNKNEIEVELKKTTEINTSTEALEGFMYSTEIIEVFCKRKAL